MILDQNCMAFGQKLKNTNNQVWNTKFLILNGQLFGFRLVGDESEDQEKIGSVPTSGH